MMRNEDLAARLMSVAVVSWAVGCGGGSAGSTFAGGDSTGATGGGNPSSSTGLISGGSGGLATSGSGQGGSGFLTVTDGGKVGAGGSTGMPPTSSDAACAAEARDSTPLIVDLFVMLDKSVSMWCSTANDMCDNAPATTPPPTRWTATTDAINSFIRAPTSAGIGVGIGFFALPGADLCNAAAYAMPVVPIATLPGSSMPISDAIAARKPGDITPTEPALQGAIDYAKAYTLATPGHTAAVVFVTDGYPHGCDSTVPGATAIAQAAFMGAPSIKTYVIGLGFVMNLDVIALAGSGGRQHYFPATGDVTAALTAALKEISKPTISCDYAIPTNGQPLDYGAVNVETRIGPTGTPQIVGKVDDASKCGTPGGWYYDANPPAKPTKITLCPESCGPLTMTDGSGLKVLIGCASIPARVN
jgi:hypothetical protein